MGVIMRAKTVSESSLETNHSVCRHELNHLGTMHGGELVKLIDEVAATCARKHAENIAVTASMDSIHFLGPIYLNDTIILKASVNRSWNTSMEIGVKVFVDGPKGIRHIATAFLTFVALDSAKRPAEVPEVIPESEDERRRYKKAATRRRIRLASRPKPISH